MSDSSEESSGLEDGVISDQDAPETVSKEESSDLENDVISDDEAPETVAFRSSRQDAQELISQTLKETRRLKVERKEKRRARDTVLKRQKRRKVDLSSAKLPESILEGISELDAQRKKQKYKEEKQHSYDEQEDEDSEDDDDSDEEAGDDGAELTKDINVKLGREGFDAVALSEERQKPPAVKDTALEFLNKQLYGGRIHRESVNKQVSRLLKRHSKPAMHFKNLEYGKHVKKRKKRKSKGILH